MKLSWGWRLLLAVAVGGALWGLVGMPALAQETTPSDDAVNQIARQLYCPLCENITLDDCTTQACSQMRALIRQQLAEGWTEEEIKDYFVAQYGDQVLGEPPARGLNWILYVLPPLAILAGIALVFFRLKQKPTEAITPPTPDVSDDPYLLQVEQDLKKLK